MTGKDLNIGQGRTRVVLTSVEMGDDLVVLIKNEMAHVGAIAVGEYDFEHGRASVSVITRLGHKDDAIAHEAAYEISRNLRKTVCVIAGVHLDNITAEEIREILSNAGSIVKEFISMGTE